jgi:hypothetical protein
MNDHMRSLGQKYMGVVPEGIYQDTSIRPEGGHDVLVDNFLNAQCMWILSDGLGNALLTIHSRLLRDHHRYTPTKLQGCP